jgi:putative ABC transport system substrate-binding protein
MNRREYITLLGSAVAAWPLAGRAQQPSTAVVGYLGSSTPDANVSGEWMAALRRGLKDMGFIEGRNVAIEAQWAQGQYDRLPALAADLVRKEVAVIAAFG